MIMTSLQTVGDPVASVSVIVSMLVRDSALALYLVIRCIRHPHIANWGGWGTVGVGGPVDADF